MINRLIAGRYQILSELGSGAMGTVYLANDSQTGAQVAIKQLINTHTEDYLVERFKREGEALRDLNHPNIVKMLDALEDNGEHFLVMEYVPAGTLKMRIEDRGAIAPLDAINMALDLADALTRAHRIGIVHRDIKPANVLIAEDETLRLTDFGVARVNNKSHMTETDGIVGTIAYLPPEALQEGHYDVRSDVWAFGILLYEMLTATHPFASNSLAQTVMNITREPVPDLEQYIPDAPLALIDLIYRMLEKDAQVRMPSVRIVGAELEAILENRTVVPIMLNETFEQTQTFEPAQHNLPVQTTPFVGRDLELGQLTRLFNQADTRLVTILAPGGMGKTRLALEIAFNRIEQYVDGVHFVDLAPLNDAERIVDAIAEAVDFSLGQTDLSAQEQLAHFLSRREMLLVLDNYEHLLDGAELVTDLLQSAPQLSLLVTSRQRLNQSGEKVFPLTGFEVSDWQSADDALESPAGQLFLQGAGRVQPNFELTDKN
ncbi:MAG: protein kinase, partial [Chloroflexota bacterium]